jgi:uncharacterized membrane protein
MGEPDSLGSIHFWIGCFALVCGAAAFISRKGGRIHCSAGTGFLAAMILLGLSGLWLSLAREILFTVFLSLIALHAVITGWAAARPPAGLARAVTLGSGTASSLIALGAAMGGAIAAAAPGGALNGLQPAAFHTLAAVSAVLSVFDWRYAFAPAPSRARRLTRHLGRMGFSLFLATGIFFFGNSHVLPAAVRQPLLLSAPVLAVLAWTAVYAIRTRLRAGRGPIKSSPSLQDNPGRIQQ